MSVTKLKPSRREVVREILIRHLKGAILGFIDLAAIPLETSYKGSRPMKRGEFKKIFANLLNEQEIERIRPNKYRMTSLGVIQALPVIERHLAKDDKMRVLVFDIPENKRKQRDTFRRHIKLLGFKKHQQSVWVSKYDCESWLTELLDYHKLGDYVSLYLGVQVR
jgi:hypothetical protein